MNSYAARFRNRGRRHVYATSVIVLASVALVSERALPANAQSATAQTSVATAAIPQWQTDAGGKMEFDVASVKPDTATPSADTMHSNIPLGTQDRFTPTGGLLSATNYPLLQYMIFAYKLTNEQIDAVVNQLPKWANTGHYDIEARTSGNPTKDQYRLMMQSLLADRFKLQVHFETKQLSVLGLVLDKPGKLGPQLQLHPDDSPCPVTVPTKGVPGARATVAGGFPEPCGALTGLTASVSGRIRFGARGMPMTRIADSFSSSEVDRPVVDRTGLIGKYDFYIEFSPEPQTGSNFEPDPNGPTFLQALKEQLGLKLDNETGSVESIVVDHIEQPSEN